MLPIRFIKLFINDNDNGLHLYLCCYIKPSLLIVLLNKIIKRNGKVDGKAKFNQPGDVNRIR